jgi:hypothetical protein
MSKVEQQLYSGIKLDAFTLMNSKPSEEPATSENQSKLKAKVTRLVDQLNDVLKLQNILNFELVKRMETNLYRSSAQELESAG